MSGSEFFPVQCAECGAKNNPYADACWLCSRPIGKTHRSNEIVDAEIVRPVREPKDALDTLFAALTALVGLTIVLVGIGLFMEELWLGVGYAILVTPPLIGSLLRIQRRTASRGYVGWGERLTTLIVSFAIMYALVCLVAAAGFIGLVIYCFASLAA